MSEEESITIPQTSFDLEELNVVVNQLQTKIARLHNSLVECAKTQGQQGERLDDHYKKIEYNFKNINTQKAALDEKEYKIRDFGTSLAVVDRTLSAKILRNETAVAELADVVKDTPDMIAKISRLELDKADRSEVQLVRDQLDNEAPSMAQFSTLKTALDASRLAFEATTGSLQATYCTFTEEQKELNVSTAAKATRHAETIDQHVERLATLEHTSALRSTTIEEMQDRLMSKAAKDSVVSLRQRIDAFSKIEHVTTLRDVMLPRLEAFSEQVDTFQADHIEMRECIQTFDATLALKSNKSTMKMVEHDMAQNYIRKDNWKGIDGRFQEIQLRVESQEGQINSAIKEYKLQLDQVVQQSIQEKLQEKFDKYDQVAKSFQQFFGQDELSSLLDRKADLELIRRVQESKANRDELEHVQRVVHDFNAKIRHISVFQSELAKNLLPSKESGQFSGEADLRSSLKERRQLLHQGKLLCNWIHKTIDDVQPSSNLKLAGGKSPSQLKRVTLTRNFALKSDPSDTFDANSAVYSSPIENIGRSKALLSGCSTRRREQTFKVLNQDFKESFQRFASGQELDQNSALNSSQIRSLVGSPRQTSGGLSLSPRPIEHLYTDPQNPNMLDDANETIMQPSGSHCKLAFRTINHGGLGDSSNDPAHHTTQQFKRIMIHDASGALQPASSTARKPGGLSKGRIASAIPGRGHATSRSVVFDTGCIASSSTDRLPTSGKGKEPAAGIRAVQVSATHIQRQKSTSRRKTNRY